MNEVRFSPDSWLKGGQAYGQAGSDLVASVSAHLSSLDVGQIGCDKGNHLVDQALAIVLPGLKEAFDESCRGLAANIQGVGEAMTDTGMAYQQNENEQTALAASFVEGF